MIHIKVVSAFRVMKVSFRSSFICDPASGTARLDVGKDTTVCSILDVGSDCLEAKGLVVGFVLHSNNN